MPLRKRLWIIWENHKEPYLVLFGMTLFLAVLLGCVKLLNLWCTYLGIWGCS